MAASEPQLTLLFAPTFKRTNKSRVRRIDAKFVLWSIFVPIVAWAAHFLPTDATARAAIAIVDWWVYPSIGPASLILQLIRLIASDKNHDVQRTEAARNFNAMARTEVSGLARFAVSVE